MSKDRPCVVLIAEDEAIVAEDIASTLRGLGYAVPSPAGSGDEALELAGALRPDLLLMDITMPGKLDGIEAARRIRKILDIPVVFLTGRTDEETLERAKGDSLFGYIIKPFAPKDIRAAVELALYKHRMERALRRANARYEAILAAIPDPIFILNRAGARVGTAAAGHGEGGVHAPDASGRLVECVERAFATGRVASVEYCLPVDEELREFEMRVVPLEDGDFLAMVRDLTGLRRADAPPRQRPRREGAGAEI